MANLRVFLFIICNIFISGKIDVTAQGLHCYNCLDIDILGENAPPIDSPFYLELKGLRVDLLFGGVDPGSCKSPSLKECDAGQTCYVMQAEAEEIYQGIQGKANVVYSLCLNHSMIGFENIPREGCVDTNKALDKNIMNELFHATFLDISGVACSCLTSGCNDPRVEAGPIDCQELTCQNGGTCVARVNSEEECVCNNWFTGDTCQTLKKFKCKGKNPCHDGEPLFAEDGVRDFPHLIKADRYVRCGSGGRCREKKCTPGLEWDYTTQACSWSDKTKAKVKK